MKKLVFALGALAFIFGVASAFSYRNNDNQKKSDKMARVKIIKEVDGKRTEIDTLINTKDDEFYFDASGKHGKMKKVHMMVHDHEKLDVDSLIKSIQLTIEDSVEGHHIMKIVTDISDIEGDVANALEDIDLNIIDIPSGDSICKKIMITTGDHKGSHGKVLIKKGCIGESNEEGDACIYFNKGGKKFVKVIGKDHSETIRLDDPTIVSFKKKDVGNGNEKIEIIRKKSTDGSIVIEK